MYKWGNAIMQESATQADLQEITIDTGIKQSVP
jgi:hypothetical protein